MLPLRHILRLTVVFIALMSTTAMRAQQDEFNPADPPEPMRKQRITVSASPAEGAQSITRGGLFTIGKTITISVTPAADYRFDHWTINGYQCSENTSFSYTVGDTLAQFVAVLKPLSKYTLTLSASPTEAGTVSGAGTYNEGTSVSITTTANTGYTFQHWALNGEVYKTSRSFTQTMTGDLELVAVYTVNPPEVFDPGNPPEPLRRLPITVRTNLPDGIRPSALSPSRTYAMNTSIILNAGSVTGYQFDHWTLNGYEYSRSATTSYTVGDTAALFVAYYLPFRKITVRATTGGSVSGSGSFVQGSERQIRATANSGYTFDYWTLNGERYSTGQTLTYTVGDTDAEFVAYFFKYDVVEEEEFNPENPPEPRAERKALTISAYPNIQAAGSVIGLPTTPLFENDEITLTAQVDDDCYDFVRWSDGETNPTRTITLTGSKTYVAIFQPKRYTITTSAADPSQGTTAVVLINR